MSEVTNKGWLNEKSLVWLVIVAIGICGISALALPSGPTIVITIMVFGFVRVAARRVAKEREALHQERPGDDADNTKARLRNNPMFWLLIGALVLCVVSAVYLPQMLAIVVWILMFVFLTAIASKLRGKSIRSTHLKTLPVLCTKIVWTQIKRHPYVSAVIAVMMAISINAALSPAPDICSPESLSLDYDRAVASICVMGLPQSEIKKAIDFAQETSLDGESTADTAEVLRIETYWYSRAKPSDGVRGLAHEQVQIQNALVAIEPSNDAESEAAEIMNTADMFTVYKGGTYWLRNTIAYAEALFKIRESAPDADTFDGFLDQLKSLPFPTQQKLSADELEVLWPVYLRSTD